MANPQWPPALPQEVLRPGYREQIKATAITQTMESGRKKRRRRFTNAPEPADLPVELDSAQVDIFKVFFNDTLKGGVLAFDWINPRNQGVVTYAFRDPSEPPEVLPEPGGKLWRTLLRLEVEP